jgi:hypothetical protein
MSLFKILPTMSDTIPMTVTPQHMRPASANKFKSVASAYPFSSGRLISAGILPAKVSKALAICGYACGT